MRQPRILIGVSACLLGYRVRYDSGHKFHQATSYLTQLGFKLVPFCPEAEIGLGIPRAPIQLFRHQLDKVNLVQVDDPGQDYSALMNDYVKTKKAFFENLSGLVLKSRSPSCGIHQIPIYSKDGAIPEFSSGFLLQTLQKNSVELPCIADIHLNDLVMLNNFINRLTMDQSNLKLETSSV